MRYLVTSGVMACVLAFGAPTMARAQNKPLQGGDESSVLAAVGLTFMNYGQTGIGAAGNVLFNTLKTTGSGRIGVVGDVGLNHFDGGTVITVMGGGRYTFTTEGKIIPYGQFLLGITHQPFDTAFNPAIGFGADFAWKENLNFRAEISFIFHEFEDPTRFFFGVSTPMKKKR
jgi:hypothetical protein